MRSRVATLFTCLSALIPISTAQPADIEAQALPPFAPAYEPSNIDERGMWMEADENERILRDSALLVKNESINKYLKNVLCQEVGFERCKGVRIYLLEVPQFNASMSPNGVMRVWTGLLLRVQNEAELAAVLGHEFAHFELRHSLIGFKQRRKATDIGAWLTVLGGLSNTNTNNVQMALLGGIYQFDRQQESAADLLGMKYMANSPYSPGAAAAIWRNIMAEGDATAAGRGQKIKHTYSAGFFDTHPTSLARADYLGAAAQEMGPRGELRTKEYREAIRPILPSLLNAQVKSNDFGGSEYLLQSLSTVEGWTGELLFARGELFRMRANPRDLVTASDLFREAIAKGYSDPVVHRELGLSLMRSGQESEGKSALQQYLALSPEASDKNVIQMLVGN